MGGDGGSSRTSWRPRPRNVAASDGDREPVFMACSEGAGSQLWCLSYSYKQPCLKLRIPYNYKQRSFQLWCLFPTAASTIAWLLVARGMFPAATSSCDYSSAFPTTTSGAPYSSWHVPYSCEHHRVARSSSWHIPTATSSRSNSST